MEQISEVICIHPEGEHPKALGGGPQSWPVDTPGGRYYAEWDTQAPVTREGQLIFFFQFLHAGGRWKEFLSNCPLSYTGNRGSGAAKVMGSVLLSVLSGHWRYAHINGVRGDGINPGLLGIPGTVSEDAVRLAMGRIREAEGIDWVSDQITQSIAPVLGLPWILDIDVTVKPLYGHQQGAQIGYNPQKPGRPSHVYHSYFVAGQPWGGSAPWQRTCRSPRDAGTLENAGQAAPIPVAHLCEGRLRLRQRGGDAGI